MIVPGSYRGKLGERRNVTKVEGDVVTYEYRVRPESHTCPLAEFEAWLAAAPVEPGYEEVMASRESGAVAVHADGAV